jgi:hypothetical protein
VKTDSAELFLNTSCRSSCRLKFAKDTLLRHTSSIPLIKGLGDFGNPLTFPGIASNKDPGHGGWNA